MLPQKTHCFENCVERFWGNMYKYIPNIHIQTANHHKRFAYKRQWNANLDKIHMHYSFIHIESTNCRSVKTFCTWIPFELLLCAPFKNDFPLWKLARPNLHAGNYINCVHRLIYTCVVCIPYHQFNWTQFVERNNKPTAHNYFIDFTFSTFHFHLVSNDNSFFISSSCAVGFYRCVRIAHPTQINVFEWKKTSFSH